MIFGWNSGPTSKVTWVYFPSASFGPWTRIFFLIGVWAVLFKTLYVASASNSRMTADFLGLTGVVLTKLDGTAKGGIVVRIVRELKLPVTLIGVGERIDDLQPFDPARFVDALVPEQ